MKRAAALTYASYAVTILAAMAVPLVITRSLGVPALGLFSLLSLPYIGGQTIDSGLALGSLAAASRDAAQDDVPRQQAADRSAFGSAQSACASLAAGYLFIGVLLSCCVSVFLPDNLSVAGTAVIAASVVAGAILIATSPARTLATATARFHTLAASNCISAVATLLLACVAVPAWHWWGLVLVVFVSVAAGRLFLVVSLRSHPVLNLGASHPSLRSLREMRRELLPAITVASTAQLVMVVDILTLSLLYDKGVVGAYRLAILIPNQVVAILFLGADLGMPLLSRARSDHDAAALAARLNLGVSFAAGLLLSVAAIQAPFLLHLLAGADVPYTTSMARLFCLSQAFNSLVHVWAIFVFARGHQGRIAGLVRWEALGNAGATIVLVALIGPLGCGVATIVAIGLSNLYFLPRLLRSSLHATRAVRSVGEGAIASLAGLGCALLAAAVAGIFALSGWASLFTEMAVTLVFACLVLSILARRLPTQLNALLGRKIEVGSTC